MSYNPFQDDDLVEEYGPNYIQAALDHGYCPEELRTALNNSVTHESMEDLVADALQFFEEEGEIDPEAEDFDHDAFAEEVMRDSGCHQLDCGTVIEFCYPLSRAEPLSPSCAAGPELQQCRG